MNLSYTGIVDFIERWMVTHPTTNCTELLGVDLDKKNEYRVFGSENMWENKCIKYIKEATVLAYDILVDEGFYSLGA